jgi:hypothetical protein
MVTFVSADSTIPPIASTAPVPKTTTASVGLSMSVVFVIGASRARTLSEPHCRLITTG